MDTLGEKNAQWGFKDMDPGWYMMKVLEGIEEITSDDGARKSFRIPLAVDEGEFAGSQQSIFVQTNADKDKIIAFNKKEVADLLENTGLYTEFEKKFPGDVDILSAPVLKGLTIKLPGKFLIGIYRSNLSFTIDGTGESIQKQIYTFAFPFSILLGAFVIFIIYRTIKKIVY